jgi:hypothetical protein
MHNRDNQYCWIGGTFANSRLAYGFYFTPFDFMLLRTNLRISICNFLSSAKKIVCKNLAEIEITF